MNRVGEELQIGSCTCVARTGHHYAYCIGHSEYVVTEGEFGVITSIHRNATDARIAMYEAEGEFA